MPMVCGLLVGAFAGGLAAAASPQAGYTDPGFVWGRGHCGPKTSGVTSVIGCKNCCRGGATEGVYPADEQPSCYLFCDRALWL